MYCVFCIVWYLPERTALARLLEELECALLRLVPRLDEELQGLLALVVLLDAHNAPLVLHQILLGESAGRVLRRAVPDLELGAGCDCSDHFILRTQFLFILFLIFTLEQLKCALLGLVAGLNKSGKCLLARSLLL